MMTTIDISALLGELPDSSDFAGPWVIYGAGNSGRAVAHYLTAKGIEVGAFLDAHASEGQSCAGIPVFRPDQWPAANASASYGCLVAIHNRAVFMPPLLEKLRQMGFRDVLTMFDFTNAFPDDQPFRFWLVGNRFYADQQSNVDALFSMLEDDGSRRWAEAILRFRIRGDYGELPEPRSGDQYFPASLPRWQEPLRFVDCGAYDGDTLQALLDAGYGVEAVAAFEPDLDNFKKLANRYPLLNVINYPCGVSSDARVVRFSAGAGEASRVTEDGDSIIQCVSLDEAIPAFAPNLIKMDIEGAEIDALNGAAQLIGRFKPNLAISLYHLPGHLWEIPLLIHGWGLGYRFYIRGHAHNSFDSVLYAVQ